MLGKKVIELSDLDKDALDMLLNKESSVLRAGDGSVQAWGYSLVASTRYDSSEDENVPQFDTHNIHGEVVGDDVALFYNGELFARAPNGSQADRLMVAHYRSLPVVKEYLSQDASLVDTTAKQWLCFIAYNGSSEK